LWVPAEDDSSGGSSSSSGSSRLKLEDTDGLMQRQQDLQVRRGCVVNCYMQGCVGIQQSISIGCGRRHVISMSGSNKPMSLPLLLLMY
jgi:hypothetical protein